MAHPGKEEKRSLSRNILLYYQPQSVSLDVQNQPPALPLQFFFFFFPSVQEIIDSYTFFNQLIIIPSQPGRSYQGEG